VADREFLAVGKNATPTVQLLPALSELPQVVVCRGKSPRFAPVTAMLWKVRVVPPVFLMVTDWVALIVPTFCDTKLKLPLFKEA
jgi:hypothetical protein